MRWPRPHTPPGYSRGRTNCFAKPPAATRWGGPVTPGGIWPRVRGPGGPARRALPPGSAPGIVGWDPVMGIGPPGMWAGQVPGKAPGPKDPAGEEPAGPWPKSGRGAGSRIPFGRRLPGLERGSGPKAVPSQRVPLTSGGAGRSRASFRYRPSRPPGSFRSGGTLCCIRTPFAPQN